MSTAIKECFTTHDTGQTYKVVSLFAKKGTNILKKKKLIEVQSEDGVKIIVKAQNSGVVSRVMVKLDDTVENGSEIVEITACAHPALMGNICCDCGMVLDDKDIPRHSQSVSMLHSVPDLKIAKEEAEKLGKQDITNLLSHQKLVLLVDLDQTLIHTTNDNIPPELKDVYHFQLHSAGPWYHTRLRPHTKEFLEKMSKIFELHICTFGVREYAHYIAHFLDPDEKLFGQRILSRNECLDPMSKKANLNSLFPCGDNLVCIIDDRTDVWNFSPNVIQVVPYHFFRHTGDINAPQGLQKKENDDRQGIDFKTFGNEFAKDDTSPEVSDEDCDKKSYSSDSDSETCTKDKQTLETDTLDSDKLSDDSAVDVNTDEADIRDGDGKSEGTDIFDVQLPKSLKKDIQISSNKDTKNLTDDCENPVKIPVTEEGTCVQNELECERTLEKSESESCEGKVEDNSVTNENDKSKKESVEKSSVVSETSKPIESGDNSEEVTKLSKEKIAKAQKDKPEVIDVVDDDDFLLYLEDILGKIHATFFREYKNRPASSDKEAGLPDLKRLVPKVRKDVLKGVNLVFSGVIPQQVKLKDSKAYQIATCFGATVSDRLIVRAKGDSEKGRNERTLYTTHLVAANANTEKVHRARRCKSIKVVTPNWLWTCVERWEVVEERLFPLTKEGERDVQRHPPHHCYCPDVPVPVSPSIPMEAVPGPSGRYRTPSGNLLEDVNPILFLSSLDKKDMAVEVDMMLSDDDESNYTEDDSEDDSGPDKKKPRVVELEKDLEDSSSSGSEKGSDEDGEDKDVRGKVVLLHGGLPSDGSDDGLSDEDDLSRMGADLESLLD